MGKSPTGRSQSQPPMQNLPGSLADQLQKRFEAFREQGLIRTRRIDPKPVTTLFEREPDEKP